MLVMGSVPWGGVLPELRGRGGAHPCGCRGGGAHLPKQGHHLLGPGGCVLDTHGAEQLHQRLHGVARVDVIGSLWAGGTAPGVLTPGHPEQCQAPVPAPQSPTPSIPEPHPQPRCLQSPGTASTVRAGTGAYVWVNPASQPQSPSGQEAPPLRGPKGPGGAASSRWVPWGG